MNHQLLDTIPVDAAHRSYLDQHHVLELLANDVVLVRSLLSAYLEASPAEVTALQRAIIANARRDVMVRAHRLRGSLRYLGARDLEDMLLEIETTDSRTTQHELLISYYLFQAATDTLEQEIRHWLARL